LKNKEKISLLLFVPAKCQRVCVGLLSCLLVACGQAPEAPAAAPGAPQALRIYTVNYPLAYMAERIGGNYVSVSFPAPGDVDPAFWRPAAEDILGYQGADLILLNGAGYAKWLAQASLPGAAMIDTSLAFSDRLIEIPASVRHKHGPEGDHSHGDVAFTTWLDPDLAALQAQAVYQALALARPDQAVEFGEAYDSLIGDLAAWDETASAAFASLTEAQVVFSHPVYQYMQRKYGLQGETVMWEPDEPVSQADIRGLAGTADVASAELKLVVWEAEPLEETRVALRELGYESVVFRPLANRPGSGDYLAGMEANIDRLNKVSADSNDE
jgi:zinc transport system substrate-binding protein